MKLGVGSFQCNRSGQILIVAALAIAVMISSTTIYVYELGKSVDAENAGSIDSVFRNLKQGARNALTSSLANVSRGGERSVLASNLRSFSNAVQDSYVFLLCNLSYSPLEDTDYESGFRLSWNTSSLDVSSVFARFNLTVREGSTKADTFFDVNVTTALRLSGSHTVTGSQMQVNLTYAFYAEDNPASLGSLMVFYETNGNWTQVDLLSLTVVDQGDGTYFLSLNVPLDATRVCLQVLDLRGIRVESIYSIV